MAALDSWSIEAYCAAQEPSPLVAVGLLPASTRSFVAALKNLTTIHPFCHEETAPRPYEIPDIPSQGPLLQNDHLETYWDVIVTLLAMGVPELAAMAELWLRLFASAIAPLGMAHLLSEELNRNRTSRSSSSSNSNSNTRFHSAASLLTVASAVVLLTDTLYILEYGPGYGASLLAFSTILALRACRRRHLVGTARMVWGLVLLALFLSVDLEDFWSGSGGGGGGVVYFGGKAERVTVQEGLYYDASNPFIAKIVNHWPQSYRTYDHNTGATRWMPTGDARTGLPFLLNKVQSPEWTRLWLPVASDGEVVALDMAFPETGHDTSQPVYLILHGLNGGSKEEYVRDFTWRRTREGSTVVVMVARGLMDLPVRGWNVFHGARWSDAHETALALRQGLVEGQVLAGVGFSMGAIILSNYVTRAGSDCALDAAVAVSGGLDMRFEIDFYRAQRLWQPLLTTELRQTFVVGKWGERTRARLTKEQMKSLMRATHISEIDKTAVVAYNGFDDLTHYYSEMSALGDVPMAEYQSGDELHPSRRIHNIAIPFCVLHALDDPLITWRTVVSNHGVLHPTNLTRTGTGNLLLLLTKRGGHVGWSLGWLPFIDKWKYMNDVLRCYLSKYSKLFLSIHY